MKKLKNSHKYGIASLSFIASFAIAMGSIALFTKNSDEVKGAKNAEEHNLVNTFINVRSQKPKLRFLDRTKTQQLASMDVEKDAELETVLKGQNGSVSYDNYFESFYTENGFLPILEVDYGSFKFYNEYLEAVSPKEFFDFTDWFVKNVSWGPEMVTLKSFSIVKGVERNGNSITLGAHANTNKEDQTIRFFPDAFFGSLSMYSEIGGQGNADDALLYKINNKTIGFDEVKTAVESTALLNSRENDKADASSKVSFRNLTLAHKLINKHVYFYEMDDIFFGNNPKNGLDKMIILASSQKEAHEKIDRIFKETYKHSENPPISPFIDDIKEYRVNYVAAGTYDQLSKDSKISKDLLSIDSIPEESDPNYRFYVQSGNKKPKRLVISLRELDGPLTKFAEIYDYDYSVGALTQLSELGELQTEGLVHFLDYYNIAGLLKKDFTFYQVLPEEELPGSTTVVDLNNPDLEYSFKFNEIDLLSEVKDYSKENLRNVRVTDISVENGVLNLEFTEVVSSDEEQPRKYVYRIDSKNYSSSEYKFFEGFMRSQKYKKLYDPYTIKLVEDYKDSNGNSIQKYGLFASVYENLIRELEQKMPYLLSDKNGLHIERVLNEKGYFDYKVVDGPYRGLSTDDTIGLWAILKLSDPEFKSMSSDFLRFVGAHEYGHHITLSAAADLGNKEYDPVLLSAQNPRSSTVINNFWNPIALRNFLDARTHLDLRTSNVYEKGEAFKNQKGSFNNYGFPTKDGSYVYETATDIWGTDKTGDVIPEIIDNKERRFVQDWKGIQEALKARKEKYNLSDDVKLFDLYTLNAIDEDSGTINPGFSGPSEYFSKNDDGSYEFKRFSIEQIVKDLKDGQGNQIPFDAKKQSFAIYNKQHYYTRMLFGLNQPEIIKKGKVINSLEDITVNDILYRIGTIPVTDSTSSLSTDNDGKVGAEIQKINSYFRPNETSTNPKGFSIAIEEIEGEKYLKISYGLIYDVEFTNVRTKTLYYKLVEEEHPFDSSKKIKNIVFAEELTQNEIAEADVDYYVRKNLVKTKDNTVYQPAPVLRPLSLAEKTKIEENETKFNENMNKLIFQRFSISGWNSDATSLKLTPSFNVRWNLIARLLNDKAFDSEGNLKDQLIKYRDFINSRDYENGSTTYTEAWNTPEPAAYFGPQRKDSFALLNGQKSVQEMFKFEDAELTKYAAQDFFNRNVAIRINYTPESFMFERLIAQYVSNFDNRGTGSNILYLNKDFMLTINPEAVLVTQSDESIKSQESVVKNGFVNLFGYKPMTIGESTTKLVTKESGVEEFVNTVVGSFDKEVLKVKQSDDEGYVLPYLWASNLNELLPAQASNATRTKFAINAKADINNSVTGLFNAFVFNKYNPEKTNNELHIIQSLGEFFKFASVDYEKAVAKEDSNGNKYLEWDIDYVETKIDLSEFAKRLKNFLENESDLFSTAEEKEELLSIVSNFETNKQKIANIAMDRFRKSAYARFSKVIRLKDQQNSQWIFDKDLGVSRFKQTFIDVLKKEDGPRSLFTWEEFLPYMKNWYKDHKINFDNTDTFDVTLLGEDKFFSTDATVAGEDKNSNTKDYGSWIWRIFKMTINPTVSSDVENLVSTRISTDTASFFSDYAYSFAEQINRDFLQITYTPSNKDFGNALPYVTGINEVNTGLEYMVDASKTQKWKDNVVKAEDLEALMKTSLKEIITENYNKEVNKGLDVQKSVLAQESGFKELNELTSSYFGELRTFNNGWYKDRWMKKMVEWELYDQKGNDYEDTTIRIKDLKGETVTSRARSFWIYHIKSLGVGDRNISGMWRDAQRDAVAFYGYFDKEKALQEGAKLKYVAFEDTQSKELRYLPVNVENTNNMFYFTKQDPINADISATPYKHTLEQEEYKDKNGNLRTGFVSWVSDYALVSKYRNNLLSPGRSYRVFFADENKKEIENGDLGSFQSLSENSKLYTQAPLRMEKQENNGKVDVILHVKDQFNT
ncbi:PDxFFG protein [Mycoplasma sp. Ms02]|uniref:PDxFFG protein n=1 Tax=Mycoplasma sp. Ms02 TaxID=353851 RepID=UPI001C8A432F|nr:PDxFFG protein [Mycoplasma sp. Ms02]QZE12209.1 PDxFFG protein [Mycoplasma sp. Ms02]